MADPAQHLEVLTGSTETTQEPNISRKTLDAELTQDSRGHNCTPRSQPPMPLSSDAGDALDEHTSQSPHTQEHQPVSVEISGAREVAQAASKSTVNDNKKTAPETNVQETIQLDLQSGKYEIPKSASIHTDFSSHDHCEFFHLHPNLSPYQRMKHHPRFNPIPVVPNKDINSRVALLRNIRQLALLGTSINDAERRAEFLDRAFEKYQQIWFEALRLGYNPGPISEEQISNRGRSAKTRKRDVSPSKVPVFVPEKFKNGRGKYFNLPPITNGQLEEAGLSLDRVRNRSETCLSEGDELLLQVHKFIGREVEEQDWDHVKQASKMNPTGTDLFYYSLYAAQIYAISLEQLRRFQYRFKSATQIKNGSKRMDTEIATRQFLLAIALEINDLEPFLDSMDQDKESSIPDQSQAISQTSTKDGMSIMQRLLEIIEAVLVDTEPSDLVHIFESSGYSKADLYGLSPRFENSKHGNAAKDTLISVLEKAERGAELLKCIEALEDYDSQVALTTELRDVEAEIRRSKESLQNLVPLLFAELHHDNATTNGLQLPDASNTEVTPHNLDKLSKDDLRLVDTAQATGAVSNKRPLTETGVEDLQVASHRKKQKTISKDVSQHDEIADLGRMAGEEEDRMSEASAAPPPLPVQITATPEPSARTEPDALDEGPRSQPTGEEFPQPTDHSQNDVVSANGLDRQDELTTPATAPVALMEEPLNEKEMYVKQFLTPVANELLVAAGHLILHDLTQWNDVKIALGNAGIALEDRNRLSQLYNSGLYHNWLDPALVAQKLRDEDLAAHPRAITLSVTTPFDPEQLSEYHIHEHDGFRYRFTKASTVAERIAALETNLIVGFVQSRIKYPEKFPVARYGTYETVSFPDDPRQKIIYHGYWDNVDGRPPVDEYLWFFNPRSQISSDHSAENPPSDNEINEQGTVGYQSIDVPTDKNPVQQKKKVTFAPTTDRVHPFFQPSPAQDPARLSTPKKPVIKLRIPAFTPSTTSAGSGNPSTAANNTRTELEINSTPTKKAHSKSKTKHRRPREAKAGIRRSSTSTTATVRDTHKIAKRGRPRRSGTLARKNYTLNEANDDDAGDSSDEYRPGADSE